MSFVYEKPRSSIADTFAGGVASIGDIYAAARQQMLFVDNTFASEAAMERAYDERNAEVFAATGIKPENPYRVSAPDALAARQERFGGIPLPELRARRAREWERTVSEAAGRIPDQNVTGRLTRSIEGDAIRIARESDEKLAQLMESRPGAGKWLGAFAGGVSGSLRDPVQIGSLLLGGGPGAGRTVAARILSTAAKEAFINGASEAAMQPLVQGWRKKAGLENGLAEAMRNVAFATAFGGAFGAGGQAIGELAGRVTGRSMDAAGTVAASDSRVAEPVRRAMAGDVFAARSTLPEIREALPAPARGALDHGETLDHLETVRPRDVAQEQHEVTVSAAHRALETGETPAFKVDDAQVERVFRAIAGDEIAPATGTKPQSLVEFLAAHGGVKDFQGELAAVGAEALGKNKARRGVRDRRLKLDHAREIAEEAGYIGRDGETQVTTVADLLAAIDGEMRGAPVYARADMPAALQRSGAEADRAGVERVVAEIASHAGPGVDDAIIREAAELALDEGLDAFDALEQVFIRAESNSTRAAIGEARTGDIPPGWSDAELEAASASRGPEPFADGIDDPISYDPEFSIDPGELEEFGAMPVPGDDGRVVALSAYLDEIAEAVDMAATVKACRA